MMISRNNETKRKDRLTGKSYKRKLKTIYPKAHKAKEKEQINLAKKRSDWLRLVY
jgi:hypothetical protein